MITRTRDTSIGQGKMPRRQTTLLPAPFDRGGGGGGRRGGAAARAGRAPPGGPASGGGRRWAGPPRPRPRGGAGPPPVYLTKVGATWKLPPPGLEPGADPRVVEERLAQLARLCDDARSVIA